MRITGGVVSGLEFFSPKGLDTRPILERSRISLFSSLGSLDGLKIIDMFAGSGAFGLEAASRGASEVIFIEKSQSAINIITNNINKLKNAGILTKFIVFKIDAVNFIKSYIDINADIVFLDPPYEKTENFIKKYVNCSTFAKFAKNANVIIKVPEKFDLSVFTDSQYLTLKLQRNFGGTNFIILISSQK